MNVKSVSKNSFPSAENITIEKKATFIRASNYPTSLIPRQEIVGRLYDANLRLQCMTNQR